MGMRSGRRQGGERADVLGSKHAKTSGPRPRYIPPRLARSDGTFRGGLYPPDSPLCGAPLSRAPPRSCALPAPRPGPLPALSNGSTSSSAASPRLETCLFTAGFFALWLPELASSTRPTAPPSPPPPYWFAPEADLDLDRF
eukprot:1195666-Prorocentrum_minimum.AAC.2